MSPHLSRSAAVITRSPRKPSAARPSPSRPFPSPGRTSPQPPLSPWPLTQEFKYLGHKDQTWKSQRLLGALEALIREETTNDSLWFMAACSLYGPFTALGPGGSDRAALCEGRWRQGGTHPWQRLLGPTFPLGTGLGFPVLGVGSAWKHLQKCRTGSRSLSVVILPLSLGSASWTGHRLILTSTSGPSASSRPGTTAGARHLLS